MGGKVGISDLEEVPESGILGGKAFGTNGGKCRAEADAVLADRESRCGDAALEYAATAAMRLSAKPRSLPSRPNRSNSPTSRVAAATAAWPSSSPKPAAAPVCVAQAPLKALTSPSPVGRVAPKSAAQSQTLVKPASAPGAEGTGSGGGGGGVPPSNLSVSPTTAATSAAASCSCCLRCPCWALRWSAKICNNSSSLTFPALLKISFSQGHGEGISLCNAPGSNIPRLLAFAKMSRRNNMKSFPWFICLKWHNSCNNTAS
mmetsp:Transcript_99112/g.285962  ORF Transcript_99112/g.285962 Transcript_99112/m.285962 type:complete len:260 (-) Transcript_99112:367-1146(-)